MGHFFAGAIRQIEILYQSLEFVFAVAPVANTRAGDSGAANESLESTACARSNVNQVIHGLFHRGEEWRRQLQFDRSIAFPRPFPVAEQNASQDAQFSPGGLRLANVILQWIAGR
jgi:hypothetical protein